MIKQEETLTAKQTTSPNGESQDKEMSEKQQQQAAQHILNAMVIVELMIDIFKETEDEKRACIVMEVIDILPKLESNLEKSYALMH